MVETDKVETIISTTPAINTMPGGVVILPLPPRPITPVNVYPTNKIVETTVDPPSPKDETVSAKNNHGRTCAQTTSNSKDTTSLNRCSEAELKRICYQKTADSGTVNNDCGVSVETCYHTRSSVKPKPDRQSRLPRTVSANASYEITSASSDDDRSPTAKKGIKLRPKREPSSVRIKADNFVTKPPPVTPLHRLARNLTSKPSTVPEPTKTNDLANPATPSMSTDKNNETATSTSSASTNPKGDFKTQSF